MIFEIGVVIFGLVYIFVCFWCLLKVFSEEEEEKELMNKIGKERSEFYGKMFADKILNERNKRD